MADENIIESYLVSLGFQVNPEDAEKFLAIKKKLNDEQQSDAKEDQHQNQQAKQRSKNAKSGVADTQKQTAALSDLQRSLRQVGSTWDSIASGDVIGALFSGAAGLGSLQHAIESAGKLWERAGAKPSTRDSAPQTAERARNVELSNPSNDSNNSNAPEQASPQGTSGSPVDAKKVDAGKKSFDNLNKSVLTANKSMTDLRKTTEAIMGPGETAAGAEAANAASSALISGAAATAGIAAAAIAATAAMYGMANGLSTANTNVETLAATMWITDSSAWSLTNTLKAMGKNVGDLNTIALNPTLRTQFEALQKYQNTYLQLPGDFKQVNDQWAQSVQLPEQELKMTLQYIQEIAGYDLSKTLVGPLGSTLAGLNSGLKTFSDDFSKIAGWASYINEKIENVVSTISKIDKSGALRGAAGAVAQTIPVVGTAVSAYNAAKDVGKSFGALGKLIGEMPSAPGTKKTSADSTTAGNSTASPYQTYDVPSYSSLAPNSTSNAYDNSSEVHYTNSPTNNINVYTSSDDPQGTASAVSGAVQSSSNEAALVKVLQGVSR